MIYCPYCKKELNLVEGCYRYCEKCNKHFNINDVLDESNINKEKI